MQFHLRACRHQVHRRFRSECNIYESDLLLRRRLFFRYNLYRARDILL
jgi:hypothetical protein